MLSMHMRIPCSPFSPILCTHSLLAQHRQALLYGNPPQQWHHHHAHFQQQQQQASLHNRLPLPLLLHALVLLHPIGQRWQDKMRQVRWGCVVWVRLVGE